MKFKQCIISLMAILLGLIAGAILMAIMGHNPIDGYSFLFQGGLMNIERIGNTLATATPLILTGLSLAFAFRTGLFNIGAPGQMLMGGFFATAVGLTVKLPTPILLPLMIIAGIFGGALWAFIPGALKAKFNVHEVVSTIMMNWIAYWIVYYMVPMYFKGEFLETESAQLPATATLRIQALTDFFQGSFINMGILIAIVSVFAIWFILNKTVLGYELKAVGFNRDAAEYAGISVNRNIVLSMMIAGALAGLAGVVQYTGNATSIQIGVMPTQGFDGIAVALLGASNPIGVLFSALFFGILYTGKGFMNAMTSIPPEIADTIMATIIYFAATSVIMERVFNKFQKRKKDKLNKNTNQETTKERVVSK
ncbi:ABC transporter permease [Clostridium perfringens]|uniref:ABC transporter permease n=1 Tax=Clostridium perfringens TaxID=1502 RepID=UPI001A2F999B|nr:ABC transporter permease [Clostridium perfringens]EHK2440682.1 ABC transporter permease [Clostridium perfringens]MCH1963211.1 ABC transporter permease [Clostridium perfringens]MDK0735228.1 ABC transporter permease [Clostridium perfringens]MDT9335637.1 ABC transporter permease [Clostridium perfringens]MDT9343394.1 ABC transporter permease [Clostridium perfringens]